MAVGICDADSHLFCNTGCESSERSVACGLREASGDSPPLNEFVWNKKEIEAMLQSLF